MSKSKAVSLSLILLVLLFLFNCSDSTEPTIDEPTELIPLKIGNSWDYILTHYDSNGTIINSNEQIDELYKDTVISGITWYAYKEDYISYFYALSNKSDGVWVYFGNIDSSVLFYKYPTFTGEKHLEYEVISLNTEVTTNAGNFKCLHIKYDFSGDGYTHLEVFIAPGIGKVKSLQYGLRSDNSSYLEYKSELKSYNLQ